MTDKENLKVLNKNDQENELKYGRKQGEVWQRSC